MATVIVAWSAPLFLMVAVVPKFESIFRDFGAPLPPAAVWILNASRWLLGDQVGQSVPGLYLVIPAFLVALGAATVLLLHGRSWPVLLGLIAIPVAAIVAITVALYAPLLALIEAFQGGGEV